MTRHGRKKQVVVIGSSDDSSHASEARAVGRYLAEKGYVLITGGRGGIMEAVSHGASERGGIVVGILPGDSLDGSNPYCTIVIPTGMGFARNAINILSADAIIAMGGRSGTLTEIGYARLYGKPVIFCDFAGGWSSIFPRVDADVQPGATERIARSVDEACAQIEGLLG